MVPYFLLAVAVVQQDLAQAVAAALAVAEVHQVKVRPDLHRAVEAASTEVVV